MTTIHYERAQGTRPLHAVADFIASAAYGLVGAVRLWHKQRRDRAAFRSLLGKDEWVFRDLGIHRGDVEWASRLPMDVNAARELEKLRDRNLRNW